MRTVENPYEENARLRKAEALASVLRALPDVKGDPGIVEHLSDDAWRLVARAAKVNVPSSTTREVVVGMLERERDEIADLFGFANDAPRGMGVSLTDVSKSRRAAAANVVRDITVAHIERERNRR